MAQATIDLERLASTIQSAITQAIEPLVKANEALLKSDKALVEAAQRDASQVDLGGLRDQILANAKVLYPNMHQGEEVEMDVVVENHAVGARASVVYSKWGSAEPLDHPEDTGTHLFISTEGAETIGRALTNLLDTTMLMLEIGNERYMVPESDREWYDVGDCGRYAAPG